MVEVIKIIYVRIYDTVTSFLHNYVLSLCMMLYNNYIMVSIKKV